MTPIAFNVVSHPNHLYLLYFLTYTYTKIVYKQQSMPPAYPQVLNE